MDIQTTKKPVLAVIGAGPKAAALAAKAEALRSCGYADIQILVFDEGEVASHWKGNGGFTSGDCILGTPPEKDVGFPYHSQFGTDVGASVDREMLKYSWAAYFVSLGNYASWVDRGRPHPRHEVWGGYIQWVLAQTSAEVHTLTKVFKVEFGANGLIISAKGRKGTIAKPYEVDGVVFTGPGKIGDIPNNILPGSNDLVDGKSYWNLIPVFKDMHSGKVAIIGAGETAASVALSIIEINSNLAVDIINPHGALFSRGESYFENQLFSSAKGWTERSLESRQEIIRRTDQGVFSVEAMDRLAESQNVHFRGGRVVWIGRAGSGVELFFEGEKKEVPEDDKAVPPEGDEEGAPYDKVVIATGFDPWTSLDLLDFPLPSDAKTRKQLALKIDDNLRLPITVEGIIPAGNVHVPMLSNLGQGPGFPNLSCLGLLADRILSAYI